MITAEKVDSLYLHSISKQMHWFSRAWFNLIIHFRSQSNYAFTHNPIAFRVGSLDTLFADLSAIMHKY